VTTKSLTSQRKKADIDADIGKPDDADLHPLIACAPHVLGGHAHLKSSKVRVERVVAALMRERDELIGPDKPLRLEHGGVIPAHHVRAVSVYVVDIFDNISKLYAELGRRKDGQK
jgi:hypothetical protein